MKEEPLALVCRSSFNSRAFLFRLLPLTLLCRQTIFARTRQSSSLVIKNFRGVGICMSSQSVSLQPAWAIPNYLEAREGHLSIDGVDALSLASEHDTPLFVFSERRIRSNIERLKRAAQAVERPIHFCYASKANSNMAVLTTVRDSGIDIEVNSGGELYKALRAGFRPDQIIFNGTIKTPAEIDEAVRAGIYSINVDSIYEIELIEESARRLGTRAHIALRLTPEIGTRSHL
ncbi:MAG: hypothetical protein ICV68_06875, partial [Pyrinomonadaceae bacterium]|nr:hypothetical protein [Pyrinomonadaceae bacterium]